MVKLLTSEPAHRARSAAGAKRRKTKKRRPPLSKRTPVTPRLVRDGPESPTGRACLPDSPVTGEADPWPSSESADRLLGLLHGQRAHLGLLDEHGPGGHHGDGQG